MTKSNYSDAEILGALAEFRVPAEPGLASKIRIYADLLESWGRKISLTTVRAPHEVLRRHFGESLFGARFIGDQVESLIDFGSGAGFPGLPIKMARPCLRITLLEPNMKKAAFLAEVVRELDLRDVQILRGRFEELRLEEAQLADCVTARAVGGFDSLLESAAVMIRREGRIVLWMGGRGATSAERNTSWRWEKPVAVPGSNNRVVLAGNLA